MGSREEGGGCWREVWGWGEGGGGKPIIGSEGEEEEGNVGSRGEGGVAGIRGEGAGSGLQNPELKEPFSNQRSEAV